MTDDRAFGDMLVARGLVPRERVEECLAEAGRRPGATLEQVLLERGYLAAGTETVELPRDLPPEAADAARDRVNVFGHYVRVQKIGAGGMGEVWRAWDRALGRWVALKLLLGTDADERARFRREAQTAARLSHPNIASVYEAGEGYIAMQLVRGQTLATCPRRDRRAIVSLVRDAARAVAFAHEQGVVHRDLKPTNIMVEDKTARVYVLDFGLAKQVSGGASLTTSGMLVGTPAYMSPEQAQGRTRDVDARSDVYGLGATLYEVLADRPPFRDPNAYDLLVRVVTEDPPPLGRFARGVDRDLETIAMKCLEKDPARRYPDAGALADDLTRWLDGEAIQARPASAMYRMSRAFRKRRGMAATVAALAVAALVGVYAMRLRPEAEAKRRHDAVYGPLWERLRLEPETEGGWRRRVELIDEALARDASSWEAWMRRGELLEKLHDSDGALASYAKALDLNPQLAAAHYRTGRVLMDVRADYEGARRAFERVRADDPLAGVARARLAVIRKDYGAALSMLAAAQPGAVHLEDLHFCRGYVYGDESGPRYDPARAVECYEETLRLNPRHAPALNNRAVLYAALNRYDEAARDHERACALNPSYAEGRVNLAQLHLHRRDPARALEILDRVVASSPHLARAYLVRSRARTMAGDRAGAREDLERAIRENPRDPHAYCERAYMRKQEGDVAGALDDCDRAFQSDATCREAFLTRAQVRRARGELDDAARDLDEALRISPHFVLAYCERAQLRAARGDPAGALSDANTAVARAPRFAPAYLLRGQLLADADRHRDAIADFGRAIQEDPGDPEAYTNRGASRRACGDPAGAIADHSEAIRLRPSWADAWYNRALAREDRRDWPGAVADMSEYLKLEPRDGEAFIKRGQLRFQNADLDGALKDFDRGLLINPGYADGWSNRGALRAMQKDFAGALRDLGEAIARDPRPAFFRNRAIAHRDAGDRDAAIADAEEALRRAPADWPERAALERWLKGLRGR